MPIPEKYLAVLEPSGIYHIFNRSHDARILFYNPSNYTFFLQLIKKYLGNIVQIHAYCLMPNHFHLVLRINDDAQEITLAFRRLFIAYTNSLNRQRNMRGNLFCTPFRRVLITDDVHYSKVIAYVHLNPVKHRISRLIPYQYSSYTEILSNNSVICCTEYVLKWFGSKEKFEEYHELIAREMLQG